MDFSKQIETKTFEKCLWFTKKCAPTHSNKRSDGTLIRSFIEKENDTLQGKIGECIVKKFFKEELNLKEKISLDFNIYGEKISDNGDLIYNDHIFSIKSIKSFHKFLLIENKYIKCLDDEEYYVCVSIDEIKKDEKIAKGTIWGFIDRNTLISGVSFVEYRKKGDYIPNTKKPLDVDNYCIQIDNLFNSEEDWNDLIEQLKPNFSFPKKHKQILITHYL